MKRVLGILLCLALVCTNISFSLAAEVETGTEANESLEFLQYYVKWDESREPEDSSITLEEYLATEEKDKNGNGIWDVLEDEEDEVFASAVETGVLGDLNGDSLVDNKDVILMYRHIAGWEQDINTRVLDFDGDGYTNNNDANHLLKYVSGWPNITLYSGKKYDIIYHVLNESMYQGLEINNTNQDYYYSSEGLSLRNIQADGYIFEGWYDGEGESATRIRKIEVGETGEVELYARWTPRTYRIDFDSELVEVATKYYTIETGATLTNPTLANYIFVGWTKQEDGRLVRGVPKGSFGNLTLSANWASRRNIAKPVQRLGDPIIAEDSDNGKILFIYRIGDIENVPLFTLYRFSTAEGIASSVTLTEQTSISASDARTISQTVANATTDSATWTLSEGWNNSTSVNEESAQQHGKTIEEAETLAKSSTNTYRLDSSQSESDVVTDSGQYAFKAGGQKSHSSSETDERGWKSELDIDVGVETGFSTPLKTAKTTMSVDVGVSHEDNGKHTETSTDSWSNTVEGSKQTSKATTNNKSWNTTSSYSNSNTTSDSRTTSQQISELITSRYGYGQSYSQSGNESSGQAFTTQNTQQDSYSNTVTYNESTLISTVYEYQTDGTIDGYYRQVLAGTAHVFAVVGYDVATGSYFVYTFTVMDDETYQFLDYSKTTPNFNDNEIGVIPFEIPFFVNEYVNSRITRSTGLEININSGTVTGYDGDDPVVVVPSYVDIDNGDGTYSSVKITGIESNAFKNNKTLETILLSEFVREIPDSAFEGCTNLQDIYIPGLTSIGSRAFYGCTSLGTLNIPTDVVSLGTNAFYNVNKVNITAANKNVALAALNSGVKNLVLNIYAINNEMKDAILEAPSGMNSFEIRGERKQYENLRIKSNAGRTTINGINFVDCTQIPMELHSSTVDLNQTSVSASGYCMILAANNCSMNLFGTNQMISSTGNAMVCGNLTLNNSNTGVQASLQVSGNIYICGNMTNQDQYLSLTNGNIINITQEQFDQYISGVYQLVYDANGGSVQETDKVAYSGVPVGTLPTPTRTGYTFAGWYTAASGGTLVTDSSTFISSSSVTIYAHWTANKYTVTFNVNGGETASPTSMQVTYDSTYGTLATVRRAGYTLDGWYTAASDGTKILSSTKVTITSAQTLYAHWTQNPELGWVRADEAPSDAIITQTSWSYREDTESTSSSMSGWTSNGSRWSDTPYATGSKQYASFPSTYKTSHSTYTELNGSAYASSGGGTNDSTWRKVTNTHAGYVYWHWAYNAAYANVTSRWISDRNQTAGSSRGLSDYVYCYFYAFKSTTNAPKFTDDFTWTWGAGAKYDSSKVTYNCANCLPSGANTSSTSGLNNPRFLRLEYFTSTYSDYQKIYKYYRNVNYSTTDPGDGSSISNKVKYVKYRVRYAE